MKKLLLLLGCVLLSACSSVSSIERPASYYQEPAAGEGGLLDGPLLANEDQKIAELLSYRLTLPQQNRIAILKLSGDNYWRFYSNDFTQLNDSLVTNLITQLRASPRVYDASFLPAMLVPEKRNLPALREAAARFQADLLLAYRSECHSYQKYRFISPSESKSYCSVEAVLLDIRSGVIVKSVVASEDFVATKTQADTNFNETIKKAELEALAKALGQVAGEVVKFMALVPTLAAAGQ
ncbi:hypothetical protein [Halioxenophilus sp. WMMB6]|uniref:hypothetical protein n=1 Tax=Halioxenophilus sp. WMMB6 TaxID=3073815 RepID=UPI00295F1AAF|nr:hypothetical protein [Halioxenophilus sp. WMMB6]